MPQISEQEIDEIEEQIYQRNLHRSQKNYKESDKIRSELTKKFNVELIDHKGFTLWKTRSIDAKK